MVRRLVVRIMLVGTISLALATLVPILPAFASPTATVQVGQPGTLVAKGAAVEVPIVYSCSSDTTFASLSVTITQRVGSNEIATGTGVNTDLLTCDGSEHTYVILVTPTNGGSNNAFRKGEALAEGHLLACDETGFPCSEAYSSGVIQIVKP
jgi:hypothetical protein